MNKVLKKIVALATTIMMISTMAMSVSAFSYSYPGSDSYQKYTFSGSDAKGYYVGCTASKNLTSAKRYMNLQVRFYNSTSSNPFRKNTSSGTTAAKVTRECYEYADLYSVAYAYHHSCIRNTTSSNSKKLSKYIRYIYFV